MGMPRASNEEHGLKDKQDRSTYSFAVPKDQQKHSDGKGSLNAASHAPFV
jgi:hypothetical protein